MPTLDFPTLKVIFVIVVLLASVIWASMVMTYRDFAMARYLLISSFLLLLGHTLISTHPGEIASWADFVGQQSIVLSIFFLYAGIRTFLKKKRYWRWAILVNAITFTSALLLTNAGPKPQMMVFLVAHTIPLVMILVEALKLKHSAMGVQLLSAGVILNILTNMSYFSAGVIFLRDADISLFYQIGSYVLLAAVVSFLLLTFGTAVMIIETLLDKAQTLATRDDLTGLSNRRHFLQELESAHNSGANSYSLLLIDIDRFKHWNDGYGHSAGDAALQYFSSFAIKLIDDDDLLARTGGDEFCLLMPEKTQAQAERLAEKLCAQLRRQTFHVNDQQFSLTISAGLICFTPGSGDSANDIMAKADAALYQAKRNGRDQYCIYQKPSDEQPSSTAVKPRVLAS